MSPVVLDLVQKVLTYRNDIGAEKAQLFYQLKRAKNNKKLYHAILAKIKHLESTEWVCWFNLKDRSFPTGHLNIVKMALEKLGADVQYVDEREKPGPDGFLPWYNEPFPPRYYQKEMIDLCLQQGRGVCVSAVGTGKSLIMGRVIQQLSVNTLIVVPSRGLSDQIYNDFKVWFGADKVEIVNAQKVRKSKGLKMIRICTVQTLASLQKTGEIQNLIHDVNCLCVDEIHHAGSASYTNLLPEIDHIYYRFGFTGTFLRNDSKSLDMWGFLSNVLYRYTAEQAIKDGFLTPLTVKVYKLAGKPSRKYQTEYDKNYCGNPELLQLVRDIHWEYGADKQYLTLVSKKDKSGKIFHEYLKANQIQNNYVSGDDKKEVISQTIQQFNDKDVTSLIGSSVIGEGIDVRSTDHLMMCQGGKSEVIMVQAIGRAIRLYEGKEMAYVHDVYFEGTKFMSKHFQQRLEIYTRNFGCEIEYVNF